MEMIISRSGVYAFLFLMMGILACSCSPSRYAGSLNSEDDAGEEEPRILFLNYVISRDSTTSIYSAELISMILRDGSIKNINVQSIQAKRNDLKLLVLDKNQQLMTSQYIPNPLDRSVEYVNDARQLERKMIHDTLQKTSWNRGKAATLLNIPRRTLQRKMLKFGFRNHKTGN